MAKKEKTAITIDDKNYFYEDLTEEQQIIVNHISDLQRKIQSSEFNLQQLAFGKDSFVNALKEALGKMIIDMQSDIIDKLTILGATAFDTVYNKNKQCSCGNNSCTCKSA